MDIKRIFKEHPNLTTWISAVFSVSYGVFNLYLADVQRSSWYFVMALFFLIIGLTKLFATYSKLEDKTKLKLVAFMILMLSTVVSILMYLTINEGHYPIKSLIPAIAQAAYSFTLIGFAVYNVVVSHRRKDNKRIMVRSLSLASAIGSILSLERTMLGTFGGGEEFIKTMEASTGAGAFIILVVIAFNVANASKKKTD